MSEPIPPKLFRDMCRELWPYLNLNREKPEWFRQREGLCENYVRYLKERNVPGKECLETHERDLAKYFRDRFGNEDYPFNMGSRGRFKCEQFSRRGLYANSARLSCIQEAAEWMEHPA